MSKQTSTEHSQYATLRTTILPGDIGSIIHLHGILYAKEYGFDHTFEPYVAIPLGEFVKTRSARDQLWIVEKNDRVMGSVAIVGSTEYTAQLRWLILHPEIRGCGVGRRLMEETISFCRVQRFRSVYLWTIDFLDAAKHLYTSAGFNLTDSKTHRVWGRNLTEERYELILTQDRDLQGPKRNISPPVDG